MTSEMVMCSKVIGLLPTEIVTLCVCVCVGVGVGVCVGVGGCACACACVGVDQCGCGCVLYVCTQELMPTVESLPH